MLPSLHSFILWNSFLFAFNLSSWNNRTIRYDLFVNLKVCLMVLSAMAFISPLAVLWSSPWILSLGRNRKIRVRMARLRFFFAKRPWTPSKDFVCFFVALKSRLRIGDVAVTSKFWAMFGANSLEQWGIFIVPTPMMTRDLCL